MKLRVLLTTLAALLASSPAAATDWWWLGLNGEPPNRVVTYLERDTIARSGRHLLQAWTLAVGESPLPSGQQHQRTLYALNCRDRSLGMLNRIAYDSTGSRLNVPKAVPEELAQARPGSIGETIVNFACGRGSGSEMQVGNPVEHAARYLLGNTAAAAPEPRPQTAAGTGFFVGPDGALLTSYHVVQGATRITVVRQSGERLTATVGPVSPANDLAVLRVNWRPTRFLSLAAPDTLRSGDRVFTLGYPVPDRLGAAEPRFTDGTVSALSGPGGEDSWVQISVPVQPGNSGGPLVTEAGHVVGIIAAQEAVEPFYRATGTLPQNINWAVNSEYAAPLIGASVRSPPRSRAEAISLARDAVALVIAER